ncbi:hypothetical protein CLV58_1467 [Spirosoma oryzae]|uniref:Swt1-like HEPN domain-containing protein n=1 Tax=Spirosoma oryzae TaxID=1469603 RepID=A0A2T0RM73_9BACT|nr:DUF499 domain-containing protein [Spirosoma oryzae]PRY22294.1 hypothetical protein CLV58_1467 [Spirosoma oryzae]
MVSHNETLFKALGLFIDAFRLYSVSILTKQYGDVWPAEYARKLGGSQRETWDRGIRAGTAPEQLIDFNNISTLAYEFKELLRPDFSKDTKHLTTWLSEITSVRNKLAHFNPGEISDDEITITFINMSRIADKTGMTDLKDSLKRLQQPAQPGAAQPVAAQPVAVPNSEPAPQAPVAHTPEPPAAPRPTPTAQPWFVVVRPHQDIRQGRLDESVFAANLADVAQDVGPEVYRNSLLFFEKTYPTAGLRTVAARVIGGLNGGQDSENRVISLQTGFGGGKTHTLISLYHLAKMGRNATAYQATQALLAQATQPTFERASIAVFTNTTNDPSQGRQVEADITLRTLWGELAYQLGGRTTYELVRANDENRVAPKGLFRRVLAQVQPALLLVDELADYCVSASGVSVGGSNLADQTISFLQELTEAVAASERCVLVTTLPASVAEVASSPEAARILTSLQARMTRVGADTKPVADDEIYEVVRRRLFENMGDEDVREAVVAGYISQYRHMKSELPDGATQARYRALLLQAYPFHPTLMDVFHKRWASHGDFQRTRGVLRLLGSIVSDLWKRQGSLPGGTHGLIHASDINFANLDALTGQMKKLYGNGYDAVLPADIVGDQSNAGKLDNDRADFGRYALAKGVATTVLLNSFGSTGAQQGIGVNELKLSVIKPDSFNHNDVNAVLDALEANAHYLHYSSNPRRYWFFTKPNLNILVNHARQEVSQEQVKQEVLKRLNERRSTIQLFHPLVDPADDVPEQQRPTLIILGPDQLATGDGVSRKAQERIERLATKRGVNNERLYRNTLLFLLPAQAGLGQLNDSVQTYLAGERVKGDFGSQLDADQRTDIKKRIDEASSQIDKALAATYSVLAKYSAKSGITKIEATQYRDRVDAQINDVLIPMLKDGSQDICLLDKVSYNTLAKAGLLPTPGHPVQASAIYEAFLRYDDKDMVSGVGALQESLQRYCTNGEYAIGAGDGKDFRRIFYQETVPHFDVQDPTYWLVDKSLYQPAPTQPAPSPGGGDQPGGPMAVVNDPGVATPDGAGSTTSPNSVPTGPRPIHTVTVHGKVDIANYSQVFQTFIMPLAQQEVEIEIRIKGKSTTAKPLTETSPEYKVVIEGARQLGLRVEEE